jgi:putative transposase
MARRRRCFVEGLSWHVTQRGVNRCVMFNAATDCQIFIAILGHECERCQLRVHGYALMRTHVHLLATPQHEKSLPQAMKNVGARYAQFFNSRYDRTGGLYEGRYRPALVHDERYWLTCMRYVEMNPVRAGIVARPEQYRWSSYAHHAYGTPDPLISEHPLYAALGPGPELRQRAWQAICGQDVRADELESIRVAIRTGIIIGAVEDPEPSSV